LSLLPSPSSSCQPWSPSPPSLCVLTLVIPWSSPFSSSPSPPSPSSPHPRLVLALMSHLIVLVDLRLHCCQFDLLVHPNFKPLFELQSGIF
jgi:hypothetical protein